MDGMTRAEIDKAVNKDFALGKGPLRPRDAATLLLLDRSGPKPKVLLGKRHHKHAFMPGKFVFPGGRTDPADARIPTAADLPAAEAEKLNQDDYTADSWKAYANALAQAKKVLAKENATSTEVQDAIRHVLVEDAFVAICLQVEL